LKEIKQDEGDSSNSISGSLSEMSSLNKSFEHQSISNKNQKFIIVNKPMSKSLKMDNESTNSKEDWKQFYD
jgi:hypothetical protein